MMFRAVLFLLCAVAAPALRAKEPPVPTSAAGWAKYPLPTPRAFLGAIPPQVIPTGGETILDLRRFYEPGPGSASVTVEPDPRCAATVDLATLTLRLRPTATATGTASLTLRARGEGDQWLTATIPLVFRPQATHTFTWRSAGEPTPQRITVAGSFNGWNKDAHPLVTQADGSFATTIELSPGEHLYKFHADGRWLPDPSNPRTLADGFGGMNSALTVAAPALASLPSSATAMAPTTGWSWQDAVMYFALTDRFANGDRSNDLPSMNPKVRPPANFHGGDWRGITRKIEEGYFERLGVNVLWLAPLNRNPVSAWQEYPEPRRWYSGYHGYWPISPTEPDPRFGTPADLRALVAAAHRRGMKVLADLVLHHVHTDHPWWKEKRGWFGQLELPDGRRNLRLWDEQQFTTWFEPYLPTFDFSNAEAVHALVANAAWWARAYDLDGFRLDAVKHIPPPFWAQLRAALREAVERPRGRPLYLVGESFLPRSEIMRFVGPNMLDGQFDFPLYDRIVAAFAHENLGLDELEKSLVESELIYGPNHLMSPLIGNHDKGRFMAYADGDLPDPAESKEEEVGWNKPPRVDRPETWDKLHLAQAFLLSIGGVPMLYQGDEYGETGAGDPDNRRDMRFGGQLSPEERRALGRSQFLGQFRRSHPALRRGTRRTVLAEKNCLAFVRAHGEDRVLCVFHRDAAPAEKTITVGPELPDGDDYLALPEGRKVSVKDGRMTLPLPARSPAFVSRAIPANSR